MSLDPYTVCTDKHAALSLFVLATCRLKNHHYVSTKGVLIYITDLTTHKLDYGPKRAGKTDSFKPEGTAFRSSEPLSDNTTNRNDYIKWPMNKPFAHKPNEWMKPEGDMDLRTTTQIEFDK